MKHIAIVITARASLARVQTVIENLITMTPFVSIVLAGSAAVSKYGDVAKDINAFLHDFSVLNGVECPIHRCAAFEPHGKDGAAMYTGLLIQELTTCFAYIGATHVVVIADRYETLAVSIAASYNGLHLTHLLGGERSGNIDDKVRFANTALADVHCVATGDAYNTLICPDPHYENTAHGQVHNTGCPSVDLALRAKPPTEAQLNQTGVGISIAPEKKYIVAMYHPCAEDHFTPRELFNEVMTVALETRHQLLWFWPNIDPGAEGIEKELRLEHEEAYEQLRLYRHLPAEQFLGLLKNADCLVGNSSVGVREAGILGTPVVDVGCRQLNRLVGPNVLGVVGAQDGAISAAIRAQLLTEFYEPDYTYGRGDAGKRIAEILCTL